jgi:hypothetical protein
MSAGRASLVVLLFLALFAAACGGDEPEQTGSTPTAQEESRSGEEPAGEGEEGETEEEREREEQEARENGGRDCSAVGDLDATAERRPPEDVRILDDARVYESEGPFGKTERFFAAVDGEAGEMPAKRDAAAELLEQNGYKVLSTDEEENTEAEAHLEGNEKTVDIQVIALCEGKLRVRYTVS